MLHADLRDELTSHANPALRLAMRAGGEANVWPGHYLMLKRLAPEIDWWSVLRREAVEDMTPGQRLSAVREGAAYAAALLANDPADPSRLAEALEVVGQGMVILRDVQAGFIAAPLGFPHADSWRGEYRPAALAATGWQPPRDFEVTALAAGPDAETGAVLAEVEGSPADILHRADQLRRSLRDAGVSRYGVAVPEHATASAMDPGRSLAAIILPERRMLSRQPARPR